MEKGAFAEGAHIMEVNKLIESLREYLKSANEIEKKKYTPILNCLQDQDFLSLLPDEQIRSLTNIEYNLNRNTSFSTIKNQPTHSSTLSSLYFMSLSYLNDKVKSITHFATKTNELETKITEAQSNINKISETADLISGATVLSEYAKKFDSQSEEHLQKSIKWLMH